MRPNWSRKRRVPLNLPRRRNAKTEKAEALAKAEVAERDAALAAGKKGRARRPLCSTHDRKKDSAVRILAATAV